MRSLEGYTHQTGRYCGSGALSNLASFYGWDVDEPACFGFGSGLASVYAGVPGASRKRFRGRAPWLERAFFERFRIPHLERAGDDWEAAWDDVTMHLETDDPVLLFLAPGALPYRAGESHESPHAVLLVGYDDDAALVSDATRESLEELSLADLRRAWDDPNPNGARNRYLVVTRPRLIESRQTAATRAVRDTATYMTEPLNLERSTGAPGEAGVEALRAFATDISRWGDDPDAAEAARVARGSIAVHGEDAAFRGLYADALEYLESWAHTGGDKGERLQAVAAQWRTVDSLLEQAAAQTGTAQRATLEEAGNVLLDVAEREEHLFTEIREHVRG